MPTKRQAIEQVILDGERWLHNNEILSLHYTRKLRQKHNVTTDAIVAKIERFALPMFKLGTLDAYINSELKKAAFISDQLKTSDPILEKARNRIKGLGEKDQQFITRQVSRICQILLLK